MRCPKCRRKFPLNWLNPGPLEIFDTPGGILAVSTFLIGLGIVLHFYVSDLAGFILYGIACAMLAPWYMAYKNSRVCYCPACNRKQQVYPWSM
ncbi:hypothetical protein KIH39_16660 [Telmatocola sphagniphila]|uniref:Uncharacterized protein n=1 Tax=Telmatocola sphagniphila TaxID=1123043 RepID=A0A8E6B2H0_9BACT|nr:hypothetical protein [Telmatocola sphagniphila]QVL30481.1 hypothetical protein KIH39_16660 [Telmatocola sphagniphila]